MNILRGAVTAAAAKPGTTLLSLLQLRWPWDKFSWWHMSGHDGGHCPVKVAQKWMCVLLSPFPQPPAKRGGPWRQEGGRAPGKDPGSLNDLLERNSDPLTPPEHDSRMSKKWPFTALESEGIVVTAASHHYNWYTDPVRSHWSEKTWAFRFSVLSASSSYHLWVTSDLNMWLMFCVFNKIEVKTIFHQP